MITKQNKKEKKLKKNKVSTEASMDLITLKAMLI
jgi:hypothetical protein